MLRQFQKFIPGFLKELDHKWLVERPLLWATRIHYVLFFGTIGAGLLFLHGLTRSISLQNVPSANTQGFLLLIPMGLAVVCWAWNSGRYQASKNHGQEGRGSIIRDQVISASIVLAGLLIPLLYAGLLSQRIDASISDAELKQDIHALQIGSPYVKAEYGDEDYEYSNPFLYRLYYDKTGLSSDKVREMYLQTTDESVKAARLEAFLRAFEKYNPEPVSQMNMKLLARTNPPLDYRLAEDKVIDNLQELLSTKHRGLGNNNDTQVLLIMIMILGMTLWVGAQSFFLSDWQTLGATILMGGASFLALALTMSIAQGVLGLYQNNLPFMLALIGYAFMLYQAFKPGLSARNLRWRNVCLTLAAWGAFLVPLSLYSLLYKASFGQDLAINLLGIGIILSLVAWNLVFRPRFVALVSQPHDR